MAKYEPQNIPPLNIEDLANLLNREFQAIAQAINGNSERTDFTPLASEPSKPRPGMQVYADGTNWDPGGGEGMYVYSAGSWVKLH